jgi:acetylornithine deacetylase/succinyl-diaminopimelate desuccinylase-like protein
LLPAAKPLNLRRFVAPFTGTSFIVHPQIGTILRVTSFAVATGLFACIGNAATRPSGDGGEAAFRELYKELVETNTTLSSGSCTEAAGKMAQRLRAAGMPAASMQVLAPPEHPRSGSLIASYPGRDGSLEPIMLLAHIDVVEARREDWERDPFKLVEEDGFFYARGVSDDKAMASIFTDLLVRWSESKFVPRRGVKLALTCGEETPENFNGVKWLLATHPGLLRAQFVLNEGAGGRLDANGKPETLEVQAGEKVYQDFTLETTDIGGHSSRPTRENAIYRMSAALQRLGAYQFPVSLNDVTRSYFQAQSEFVPPDQAADMHAILRNPQDDAAAQRLWTAEPSWNGMLRTTCTATEVTGGHAPNALPQRATVNVNCRILPGVSVEDVRSQLVRIVADPKIDVRFAGEKGVTAPMPTLTPAFIAPIEALAKKYWPEAHVVPTMATGATDGRFLNAAGISTYGVSGLFTDAKGSGAHGLNERLLVKSVMEARKFLQELVLAYAQESR